MNSSPPAKELGPLELSLKNYIKTQSGFNSTNHVSLYVRDLNNGPWIGVHEKEKFSPASLLKVPLMITYYRLAENNPTLLQEQLEFTPEQKNEINNVKQTIVPSKILDVGNTYTIDDLLKRMVIYSDNNAWIALVKHLPDKDFYRIYTDMGFSILNEDLSKDFISVKDYSSFFRMLYNASYLTHSDSEKALGLLTKTEYHDGLSAQLPKSLVIAHKFGERELPNGIKQLHDCGIVYYPDHPYLICVMTRGTDMKNLQTMIQSLSKKTYDYMKNLYK